jgi:hypothetical protein
MHAQLELKATRTAAEPCGDAPPGESALRLVLLPPASRSRSRRSPPGMTGVGAGDGGALPAAQPGTGSDGRNWSHIGTCDKA